MRFLNFAIHYPKPEHVEDLLGAMYRLADAVRDVPGLLQMAAFHDELNDRILAVSIWDSAAAFQAAGPRMMPIISQTPFDSWERKPREITAVTEAAATP
jgi:quinol monooxygenase YgiN